MEFGRAEKELKEINHKLPPDGQYLRQVLNKENNTYCSFYVGLSRWGRKEWCGSLYPTQIKEKEFQSYYGRLFNSIELNATCYSLPTIELIEKWKENFSASGNSEILFVPKASNEITHRKELVDCKHELDNFMNALNSFDENLGPVFFQMGENFGPNKLDLLTNFISILPKGQKFFFELRNKKWFENKELFFKALELFTVSGIGIITTDTSGRRDCIHMELTNDELFLRFVGNGEDDWELDFERANQWISRIKEWIPKGLKKVYWFIHQYDDLFTPKLAAYIVGELNGKLNANLMPIKISGS